ncbi:2-hydroxyisoflavanone dehydratase-like protein [Tanacetum coccineum]
MLNFTVIAKYVPKLTSQAYLHPRRLFRLFGLFIDLSGLVVENNHSQEHLCKYDKLIKYLYPGSSGSTDDPKLYPGADPDLEKLGCPKVLIVVAEKDYLKPRGIDYKETLEKSKWEGIVEFMENEDEGHCFYLFDPSTEKAKGLIQILISYLKQ